MKIRSGNKGSFLLGMAGLIALLSVLCAIILSQSGEAYRAAGGAEARMRARAAAEGAVVLILHSPQMPTQALKLAGLDVVLGTVAEQAGQTVVPLSAGTEAWQFKYVARFNRSTDGRLRFVALEKNP